MSEELRPCPFCGGDHVYPMVVHEFGHSFEGIKCASCTSVTISSGTWQSRPLEDALQAERDELKIANSHLSEKVTNCEKERDALRQKLEMAKSYLVLIKEMTPERSAVYHFADEAIAILEGLKDAKEEKE